MSVKPIPPGYHTATPYLILQNAAEALDFYKKAFGAVEIMRMQGPDGKVMHAEIKIGNSPIMMADGCGEMGFRDPHALGGSPVGLHLYVENVDTIFAQAVSAGAKVQRPVADQFYGDRTGTVVDPYGHVWSIATHIEDVSEEEIRRRAAEWMKKAS